MKIDRASLEELVQNADIEGFLAEGSPSDEYDLEIDALLQAIQAVPAGEATENLLITVFADVWRKAFSLSDEQVADRRAAFEQVSQRILHFFPEPV